MNQAVSLKDKESMVITLERQFEMTEETAPLNTECACGACSCGCGCTCSK